MATNTSEVKLLLVTVYCCTVYNVIAGLGYVSINPGPRSQRYKAGVDVWMSCSPHVTSYIETGQSGGAAQLVGVPRVAWYKDDININALLATALSHPHYHINTQSHTLTIRNVTTRDSGNYICEATVGHTSDSKSALLVVEDVPDPPTGLRLTSCEDRVAQLKWQLGSENHSPVTQYIIQYNTSFSPDEWKLAKIQRRIQALSLENEENMYEFERIILSPWANYSFRVIATNAVGNSLPSKPTRRWCEMPPDRPQHHPTGVCTLNERPNTLVIAWTPMTMEEHNGPGFHYIIQWSRHDFEDEIHTIHLSHDHLGHQNKVNTVTIEDPQVSRYVVEYQPSYKPYNISVQAANEEGYAVNSFRRIIGYSSEDTPRARVLDLRIDDEKPVTNTTAHLVWTQVNIDAWNMQGVFTGYKIQFWRTDVGLSTLRNHTIFYDEPPLCWRDHDINRHARHSNPISRDPGLLTLDTSDTSKHTKRSHRILTGRLINLWPYSNITAHIRVLNAKYEGPPSEPVQFTTKEGVPSGVVNLRVTRKDAHALEVSWSPPQQSNGVLQGYILAHTALDTSIYSDVETFVPPDSNTVMLTNLLADTPYHIKVFALTAVGKGVVSSIEENTLPRGPPVAPNFTTVNESKRSVNVTWFPSTQGFPGTGFVVMYKTIIESTWTQLSEETKKSWAVIDGLASGVVYEIRVVARSGNTKNSPETSSPVQRFRLGLKRDLPQPTFELKPLNYQKLQVYLNENAYVETVYYFTVQYRTVDTTNPNHFDGWRTSDNIPRNNIAIIENLTPGVMYHVKVITTSDGGESSSIVQTYYCCTEQTESQAPSSRLALNNGACAVTCQLQPFSYLLLVLITTVIAYFVQDRDQL